MIILNNFESYLKTRQNWFLYLKETKHNSAWEANCIVTHSKYIWTDEHCYDIAK